jgi:hypothetical protein
MAYRFNLGGHDVSCDSVEELLAVLPGGEATVVPTSKKTRARRVSKKSDARARGGAAAWRIARLYGEANGMTPSEARTYLREHPRLKTRFLKTLESATT